jgi:hypothetical protein
VRAQGLPTSGPAVGAKLSRAGLSSAGGRGWWAGHDFSPETPGSYFFFFLFHFKLPIFKLNLNSCFELYIPNLKQNPNVNVNPKIFNIIVYSPSQYLILATNDFITTFFFSFSVLYFHL